MWEDYKRQAFILGFSIFIIVHGATFIFNIEPQTASLFFTVFYLPLLSISLLLLFPVFSTWKVGSFLKMPVTVISLISYALYLVNYSLVLLTLQEFVNIEECALLEKLEILVLFWLLSFVLAFVLYKYFEKPIMNLRDSQFIRKRFLE